jgi:hypothetical protein
MLNFLHENEVDALVSQIHSWNETLHVSDSSFVSRIRMELQFYPDPARKLSANLYDNTTAVCTVENS